MLIEMPATEPVALFLFAHQDDEFGVYQSLAEELASGRRVLCCYFTDGGFDGVSIKKRNAESTAVLTTLGVSQNDIVFCGESLAIPDGKLIENLRIAGRWMNEWLGKFSSIEAIYVPAWEGGHHDHDALHALAVLAADCRGLLPKLKQFPLYNALNRPHPFFRVKVPVEENGPITYSRAGWRARYRYLKFCASYPSQLKTWLGLFPFVLFHYIFDGRQALQPVNVRRLRERPHAGALYYERRQFCTWEKMQQRIQMYRVEIDTESK